MKKTYQSPINRVVALDVEQTLLQASDTRVNRLSDSYATKTTTSAVGVTEEQTGGGDGLSRDNNSLWDNEW